MEQHSMFIRGERVSAIAVMSVRGILDVLTTTGSVNGDTFYEFAEKYLLPQLQPFDGSNKQSVVIMDNCSIHHVPEVVGLIEEVGAIVHFPPPFSRFESH